MNPFDQQIKDAYEGHEASFDQTSWDELHTKLDHIAPSPVKYFAALSTGIAATGLVFLALLYAMSESQNDNAIAIIETQEEVQVSGQETSQSTSTTVIKGHDADTNGKKVIVSNLATEQDSVVHNEFEAEELTYGKEGSFNPSVKAGNTSEASQSSQLTAEHKPEPNTSASEELGINQVQHLQGDMVIASTDASNKRAIHTSCAGLTIHFDASQDYGKDAKFLWNFGDGFFSNDAKPSHTFNKSGTFDVSLSVTSPTTGQISSNVVQAKIEVLEAPRARTKIMVPSTETIQLENISIGEDNNEWWIDGETLKSSDVATLPFKENSQSEIRLVVLNENGCSDTLTQYLKFKNITQLYSIDKGDEFPFKAELANGNGSIHIFDAVSGKLFHTASDSQVLEAFKGKGEYVYIFVNKGKDGTEISRGAFTIK